MSIPGTVIGGLGGLIVEKYGYTNLYIFAFIAAVPSMILLPWAPIRAEEQG
jgi:sugar phosphate permease